MLFQKDDLWPIGQIIQEYQVKHGMTNKELASKCNVSVRALNRVKAGGSCSIMMIEKILWELGYELTAQPIGGCYGQEKIKR